MSEYVDAVIALVKAKNPSEPEFHQAVEEVAQSLELVLERASGVPERQDTGTHGRAGAGGDVPGSMDG